MSTHNRQIQDQFTKQASLFQASHRLAETAIAAAVSVSEVNGNDNVLDVACGPGVLSCAFAKVASHVTGIDITPSMLEAARKLQESVGLSNVTWKEGDVYNLPFPDNFFSLLITRYAFHHIERPKEVLREMIRVCKPDGRIVVIDSAPPPEKANAFNLIEKRRDPSHTKALTQQELTDLMVNSGLSIEKRLLYAWEVTAESLLARSFPADGDRNSIYLSYEMDVGLDMTAMNPRFIEGVLNVTFPTLITTARKNAVCA